MAEKQDKAVALKYDKDKNSAPKIVAKGQGILAEKIEDIARSSGIYIAKDKHLVEGLYKMNIGSDIPEELYEAVAKILVFVYNLKSSDRY